MFESVPRKPKTPGANSRAPSRNVCASSPLKDGTKSDLFSKRSLFSRLGSLFHHVEKKIHFFDFYVFIKNFIFFFGLFFSETVKKWTFFKRVTFSPPRVTFFYRCFLLLLCCVVWCGVVCCVVLCCVVLCCVVLCCVVLCGVVWCGLVGWSVGRLGRLGRSVGRLVGWSVGRSVGWLVDLLIGWSSIIIIIIINQPTNRPTSQPANRPTDQPTNQPTNQMMMMMMMMMIMQSGPNMFWGEGRY